MTGSDTIRPAAGTASSDEATQPASKRQRIAKLMARAGLCSRRDAEAWIVAGRVSVNGEVLTSPALDVAVDEQILVDGVPLPTPEKTRLFLFHKPRGLVTSDHDPEGRATVADFLREHWPQGPRVVTVGRLDINTEGLLLLTNDGGLARVLELPQTGWVRRYRVRAKGAADPAALEALAGGVTIDGIDYAGIEAKLDRVQGANVWMTMGLREGKNREIKRVLEHMGLEVNRLIRLSFGPFQLLELAEGAVDEVRTRVLRDQLGAKLAEQAGVDFGEPLAANVAAPPAAKSRAPDRATAQRGDRRDAKPMRPGRGAPGSAPRPGDRPTRRRDATTEAPAPRRERPARGTRKHVTTLRAERDDAARAAPRARIERSDTRDRRDRSVTVERLVRPQASERVTQRPRSANGTARSGPDRNSPGRPRTDRAASGEDRAPHREKRPAGQRRHASPSAEGKRERIARSGPRRDEPAARGHVGRGRPGREQEGRGQANRGQANRGQPNRGQAGRGQATGDASTSKRSTGARSRAPARDGAPSRPSGRAGRPAAPAKGPRKRSATDERPAHPKEQRRDRPRDARSPGRKPSGGRPPGKPPGGRRGPSKPPR